MDEDILTHILFNFYFLFFFTHIVLSCYFIFYSHLILFSNSFTCLLRTKIKYAKY